MAEQTKDQRKTKKFDLFQCCGSDNTNKAKQAAVNLTLKRPQSQPSHLKQQRRLIFEKTSSKANGNNSVLHKEQDVFVGTHVNTPSRISGHNNIFATFHSSGINQQIKQVNIKPEIPRTIQVAQVKPPTPTVHIVSHNNFPTPKNMQVNATLQAKVNVQTPKNNTQNSFRQKGFINNLIQTQITVVPPINPPKTPIAHIANISNFPTSVCNTKPVTPNCRNVHIATTHIFTPEHFYHPSQVAINPKDGFANDRHLVEQLTIKRPLSVHGKQMTRISAIIVPKIIFTYSSPQIISQHLNRQKKVVIQKQKENPQKVVNIQTPLKNELKQNQKLIGQPNTVLKKDEGTTQDRNQQTEPKPVEKVDIKNQVRQFDQQKSKQKENLQKDSPFKQIPSNFGNKQKTNDKVTIQNQQAMDKGSKQIEAIQ